MRVCIDPGHGGKDPGAVAADGTREADIALVFADRLGHHLRSLGHETVFTHRGEGASLGDRCRVANDTKCDVFLSVHCNAHANSAANGTETLYYSAESLAIDVQTALLRAGRLNHRGIKKRTDLYVLKHTTMPAILVELGFVSNVNDLQQLTSEYWREEVAGALAAALDQWGRQKG